MSKGQHSGDGGGGGVNLSYIITPFLDMSFQLLAFFIMTYHPSALEGHIDGRLVPPPTARNGPVKTDPMQLPGEVIPDLAETMLVKVTAGLREVDNLHNGEPEMILLKSAQDATWTVVADHADGGLESALNKLEVELQRAQQRAGGAELTLRIDADGKLRYAYVMRVYDVGRRAGFQNISFVGPTVPRTLNQN